MFSLALISTYTTSKTNLNVSQQTDDLTTQPITNETQSHVTNANDLTKVVQTINEQFNLFKKTINETNSNEKYFICIQINYSNLKN